MDEPVIFLSNREGSLPEAATLCKAGYYSLLLADHYPAPVLGRLGCDFQDSTLLFISPESAGMFASTTCTCPRGTTVAFDPDYLTFTEQTSLMSNYPFFRYYPSEMLHLSASERRVILRCMENIHGEITRREDSLTRRVLSRQVGLLLDQCVRFYERQFITRCDICSRLVSRYATFVTRWIEDGKLPTHGAPSLSGCAELLGLSPAYFVNLLQFGTGKSHEEYVQGMRIEIAKRLVSKECKRPYEIAALLGFPSEKCFSRFFQKFAGCLPEEYSRIC